MAKLENIKHEYVATEYAKRLIAGGGKTHQQIYQEINPNIAPDSARVNSTRILARPDVRTRVAELLASSGVPLERIMAKYSELLDAQKDIISNGVRHTVRDNSTQMECLKLGLKMYQLVEDAPAVDSRSLTFNVSDLSGERLLEIARELKSLPSTDSFAIIEGYTHGREGEGTQPAQPPAPHHE